MTTGTEAAIQNVSQETGPLFLAPAEETLHRPADVDLLADARAEAGKLVAQH